MSKKQKARIKDLERTLRASVARNAIVFRENRELWTAYEAVRKERDDLQREYDAADRESANAWMSNIALRNRLADVEGQLDSLAHDLGECHAGREALERRLSAPSTEGYWRKVAMRVSKDRDDDKETHIAELESLQDQIETAHRWKTYADSIESQIEILQTAIDERDERLDNIKFFLSDGDEG